MMDTVSSSTSMKNVLMTGQTAALIPMQLEMTSATLKTTSRSATLMAETAVSLTKLEMATVTPSTSIECAGMMKMTVLANTT